MFERSSVSVVVVTVRAVVLTLVVTCALG